MDDNRYFKRITEEIGAQPHLETVYKYTGFDTAEKIIENNSLKFSSPLEFNDPFELSNYLIDTNFTINDIREWVNMQRPDLNNSQRRAEANRLFKNPTRMKQVLNDSMNKYKTEVGICSFSKDYQNPLMWAHYAEMHKGVCLGFHFQPFTGNGDFFMLGVAYADEIKPLNYFRDREFIIIKWVFTKSSIWEYEEEVRAVYIRRNGFIKFDKPALKEVHFGLRTSDSQRNAFLEKINALGYRIDRSTVMEINPNTWDLRENTINQIKQS